METHLNIIGVSLILLAIVHVIFPRYFNWKAELASLSLVNRQMMHVHTFFIGLTVFLMGLLCITSGPELISTSLGKIISLGLAIFWSIRLFIQLFVYSPILWKGKAFETGVHIIFSIAWLYISWVFWGVVIS